jgi:hypothetical protein
LFNLKTQNPKNITNHESTKKGKHERKQPVLFRDRGFLSVSYLFKLTQCDHDLAQKIRSPLTAMG